MNNEKVFGQGFFAKKKELKYGPMVEISVRLSDAIPFLQQNVSESGYVNLKIYGSREPRMDDRGNEKLVVELDTWQPTPRVQAQNQQSDYNQQQYTPQQPQQPAQQYAPNVPQQSPRATQAPQQLPPQAPPIGDHGRY
jgi:hypothetical protein